jgi:hypothetical protein
LLIIISIAGFLTFSLTAVFQNKGIIAYGFWDRKQIKLFAEPVCEGEELAKEN